MDWSQIQSLFQNFGALQWLIVGAIAFLVGTSPQVKTLAAKALAKVRKSDTPLPVTLDGTNLLAIITTLESRRELLIKEINAREVELAEIDKMLGVKRD